MSIVQTIGKLKDNISFHVTLANLYYTIKKEVGTIPNSCYISGTITDNANAEHDFEIASNYVKYNLKLTPINPIEFAKKYDLIGDDKDDDYYSKIMLIDLILVKFCKNMYMIKNWQLSTGAFIEHLYAKRLKKQIYYQLNTPNKPNYFLHIENTFKALAKYLDLSPEQLQNNRHKRYIFYKHLLLLVFVREFHYQENYLGTILNKDYSSILSAIETAEGLMLEPNFRDMYNTIKEIAISEYSKMESELQK